MIDYDAKQKAAAEIIEGQVLANKPGLAICIKGLVFGFPAMLQAIAPAWPFGCTYIIETEVIEDPNAPKNKNALNMTLYPRLGRGFFGFFTHVLLGEAKGMTVRDKKLESKFVFSYNYEDLAERFVKYPGVADRLLTLELYSKFKELTIKSDAGIMLIQPKSFKALDLDVCRETFRILGELGQIIFEAF